MDFDKIELINCYVDESIHNDFDFVVTAFVFSPPNFNENVFQALKDAGLSPPTDEFKSSARMDENPEMRKARSKIQELAVSQTKIAVFFDHFERETIGKHSLQALQSVLVRNGIDPRKIVIFFDEDIFPSEQEALRLQKLFHYLEFKNFFPREDSKIRYGIQVADSIAHCFGQILKEELSGQKKLVDIGGEKTGYAKGEMASLGWELLMRFRHCLLTRPMIYNGEKYNEATDPIILDPVNDDPVNYGQHPILNGWGIQVSPDSSSTIRESVEKALGRIWLGCIH